MTESEDLPVDVDEEGLDLAYDLGHWMPSPNRLVAVMAEKHGLQEILVAGVSVVVFLLALRGERRRHHKSVRELAHHIPSLPGLPRCSKHRAWWASRYAQVFHQGWQRLEGLRDEERRQALLVVVAEAPAEFREDLRQDLTDWSPAPERLVAIVAEARFHRLVSAVLDLLLFLLAYLGEARRQRKSTRALADHVPGASKHRAWWASRYATRFSAAWWGGGADAGRTDGGQNTGGSGTGGGDTAPPRETPPPTPEGAQRAGQQAAGGRTRDDERADQGAPAGSPTQGQGFFSSALRTARGRKRDGQRAGGGHSRDRTTTGQDTPHSSSQRENARPRAAPAGRADSRSRTAALKEDMGRSGRADSPAENRSGRASRAVEKGSAVGNRASPQMDSAARAQIPRIETAITEAWEHAYEAVRGDWDDRRPSARAAGRIRELAEHLASWPAEGSISIATQVAYREVFERYIRHQQAGHAFPDPRKVPDPGIGHALSWVNERISTVHREVQVQLALERDPSQDPDGVRAMLRDQAAAGRHGEGG